MESLFGIKGKNFVITAFNTNVARSICVMKHHEDKSRALNKHTLLLFTGEPGDAVHFAEYIQANVKLYGIRNNIDLGPKAAAHFTRKELAGSLRSRKPYHVNLLIAGYDEKTGPELYWLDYFASMTSIPYAAQGYGAYFCLSLMDRFHHPDMTKAEARALMIKVIEEMQRRFMVNMPEFYIKIVDENGISETETYPKTDVAI